MQGDIAQIFFPNDSLEKEGYLIGFNIQGFVFTIITVDDQNDFQTIEKNLTNMRHQNTLQQLCGARLQILGVVKKTSTIQPQLDTWVHLDKQQDLCLKSLLICGYEYRVKCCIIFYDKIPKNQTITFNIQPLSENLLQRLMPDEFSKYVIHQISNNEHFNSLELLKDSFDSQSIFQGSLKELHELQYSLIHLNMRKVITMLYQRLFVGIIQDDDTQTSLYKKYYSLNDEFLKKGLKVIINVCAIQRFLFLKALQIIEFRIPVLKQSMAQIAYFFFKNTLAQVKYKLGVMNQWEPLAQILSQQSYSSSLIFRAYHQLFAGIIFMAVDTFLGIISLLFLYFNVQTLLLFIHRYATTIHIQVLSEEVEWLMGFPAGLKTNKPLNSVMGHLILQVILLWGQLTTFLTPYEPYLLRLMIFFCLFGVTFQISMAGDLIRICTIHVYYIYRGIMLLYREIGNLVAILFQVTKDQYFDKFQQKWLQKSYLWDQKMLSMFFCFLFVMMMPTVALYYFWFLLIVLFIYVVNVFLNTILQVFNQFPLFLVIMYLRFPSMFPVSVTLEVQEQKDPELIHTKICSTKMPILYLFKPFLQKIILLRKIVDIPGVIRSALYGQDIMKAIRKEAKKQHRKGSKNFVDFVWKKNNFGFQDFPELRKLYI